MRNFSTYFAIAWRISAAVLVLYGFMITYSHFTRTAMYSHELPPNMVCLKDSLPHDGYVCMIDWEKPWYIEPVGELAQVN